MTQAPNDTAAAVSLELDGDIAVIRIDDGKANALSHEIISATQDALATARTEAKAVALIGREGKFSAGFDLTTMKAGPAEARDLLRAGAELGHAIYVCPVPVVIGCTGHALAMGAIALFCADVRIGAEGPYKIGMNEVAIGMPVPRFAIELASDRLTNRALTAAVNLAQVFDPAAAVEAGYLDEVVPLDEVPAAAIDRAKQLASTLQPTAFRLTREYLRGHRAEQVMAGLALDIETFTVEPS
jgi:enoyl-CoA hydratase